MTLFIYPKFGHKKINKWNAKQSTVEAAYTIKQFIKKECRDTTLFCQIIEQNDFNEIKIPQKIF